MTVDKERYTKAIKQHKIDFIIKVCIFAALMIASVVLIVLMIDQLFAVFIGAVALVWFAISLIRVILVSFPKTLFSGELEGTVVKTHVCTPPPSKRSSRSSVPVGRARFCGELYILTKGGKVEVLTGLTKEATEIYKKGDKVFRIAGTKCPIILERELSVIPCPVCSGVYTNRAAVKCPHCSA